MEQLVQLLRHALGLAKRLRWQDPAVVVAVTAVHLLRPKVSRWVRKRRHDKWAATQATATWTKILSRREWAVFYYYFVGPQRYGGYRTFHARSAEQAQESAKWLKGKRFMVRYNPAKPQQSAVFAADNPALSALNA